jgi:HlyD family secretion protein
MNKWSILAAGVIIGLAFVVAGCGGAPPTPTPTPLASAVKASAKIIAEGKVVPARGASLSFPTGGIIAQIPVALGDKVEAGKLLARLDTKQGELELVQSEAKLASAQAKLSELKRGPRPEELAAAQQNITSAQAAYDNLLQPDPSDLIALKADVDKAQAALDRAQAAYDRIGGDSNPFAGMTQERAALQSAWLDYQKATTLYQAKTKPSNAQVQQALATLQTAKSQLAKLQPSAEDIAAAQADVNAAQAARDLAGAKTKDSQLVAPFAGVVTALDIKAGEYAAPGTVVARLADSSAWQVETTDLTELNIVSVAEGGSATLEFDAIPSLEVPGKVTQIKSYGENRQGDIVYMVVVKPDQQDPRLRWNMTAKVTIEPNK